MKISLAHKSTALLYGTELPDVLGMKTVQVLQLAGNEPAQFKLEDFDESLLKALPSPLHVMVPSRNTRLRRKNIVCHYRSDPLPASAFRLIGETTLVVSPEVCFAQMSSVLPRIELIKLGNEFCSTYVPHPLMESQCLSRLPLTTVEKLCNRKLGCGLGNRRRIDAALPWIVDNSASPRETALYMLLCLPYRLGGYNLPKPMMNYEIPLTATESRMAGKHCFRADLFWPEFNLDVEYDSTQFHLDEQHMETDAIRRNVLNHKGIRVISVTRNQMNNVVAFDAVARQIAEALGKRIQVNPEQFHGRRKHLRNVLFK